MRWPVQVSHEQTACAQAIWQRKGKVGVGEMGLISE